MRNVLPNLPIKERETKEGWQRNSTNFGIVYKNVKTGQEFRLERSIENDAARLVDVTPRGDRVKFGEKISTVEAPLNQEDAIKVLSELWAADFGPIEEASLLAA